MEDNKESKKSIFVFWKRNIIYPFLVGNILFVLSLSIFFFQLNKKEKDRSTNIIAKTLVTSIRNSVLIGDTFSVRNLISRVGEEYNSSIRVLDVDGSIIAEYRPNVLKVINEQRLLKYSISSKSGAPIAFIQIEREGTVTHFVAYSLIFLAFVAVLFLGSFLTINRFKKIIQDISQALSKESYRPCFKEINDIKLKNEEFTKMVIQKNELNSKQKIYRQVAHDIRSPLEALRSVVAHLDNLDFSTKEIISNSIGRIAEIANGLLLSGSSSKIEKKPTCLKLLVEDIIKSKEAQYNTELKFFTDVSYSNSFINGNETELYRALSNLINNAYESQIENVKIHLTLSARGSDLILSIRDFGTGMSQELLEKVLKGGTTTKAKGNGLGLSYSLKIVKEHFGEFKINSILGEGTTVIIKLLKVDSPKWFIESLNVLDEVKSIVCVDDDISFLSLYKDKFRPVQKQVHVYNEKQIEDALLIEDAQYFFDLDIKGSKTGLDYIIENNLTARATLVTSMYQEEEVQNRCLENNVKILPKQILNNSQIKFEIKSSVDVYDVSVLIDDDHLIHMFWKMEAEKNGKQIKTFYTVNEFLEHCHTFSKKSRIFVDSNLAGNIKGEVESKIIYDRGFDNIYLATGYDSTDIDRPYWIKEIVGKRPRF